DAADARAGIPVRRRPAVAAGRGGRGADLQCDDADAPWARPWRRSGRGGASLGACPPALGRSWICGLVDPTQEFSMSFSAAAGNVAPTVIHTDTQGLVHGDFRLPVADGSIDAYYAAPEGKRDLPIVLVVQEIFGVHEHIKDLCRRVAKAGYLAVAANLYER